MAITPNAPSAIPAPTATTPSPSSPASTPEPSSQPPSDPAVQAAFEQEDDGAVDDGLGDLSFLRAEPEGAPEIDDEAPAAPAAQPTAAPAAASTPSAAPAVETAPAPAAPAGETPVQTAVPAQPAVPAQTPQAVPAQPQAAAPTTPAQPVQPAAQPAAPSPETDYGAWRSAAVDTLAAGPFALSEETVAALQDEPAKVWPKLAANLYMMAVENATVAVREMLPDIVPTLVERRSVLTKAQESFNSAAPDLVPHMARVTQISTFLRSQYPDMPTEEYIPLLARTARHMLNLPDPVAAAPAAPAAPVSRPLPPHTPVLGSGARPAPAPARTPANSWAELAGARDAGSVSDDDEDD